MRRRHIEHTLAVAVLTWAMTLLTTQLLAQTPAATVTAYADESGSSCSLTDDSEKVFHVYVITRIQTGVGAVRFRVVTSPGFSATYMGEVIPFQYYSGDTQAGLLVNYGDCFPPGKVLTATISYAGHGTSAPCSYLTLSAHPQSYFPPNIEAMDCAFDWWPVPTNGPLYVNPVQGQCPLWCAVGTSSSTWGHVKALYR
jgi:hypothetical protein